MKTFDQPILEYVIFCHQEDTLWPFCEAKQLKEILDDIFQTAEFQKVLDQIKKDVKEIDKENPHQAKVLEGIESQEFSKDHRKSIIFDSIFETQLQPISNFSRRF